jgi:mannose-6-phosphate isomerase-like protein (cupin superfamily)
MLSFLKGPEPKRTKRNHLKTFKMENGRSSVSFNTDPNLVSKKASIAFTLPPCEPGPNPKDNSVMIPAWHTHPSQQEFFLITSGTCLFSLNRKQIPVSAGHEIVIPSGEYHRFTNASTTEPMTLEAWYDPADLEKEERIFRNLCGYLEDHQAGSGGMTQNMSILQLAVFAWESNTMLCEPSMLT